MKKKLLLFLCLAGFGVEMSAQQLLVETELFDEKGGWIVDAQFVDQMGSPYLLAHGLGIPVDDAVTDVAFSKLGTYHIWVRTKDWIPDTNGPGSFRLSINGQYLNQVFGSDGIFHWHWVYGGKVDINSRKVKIRLNDLTGFAGRCDAIFLSMEKIQNLPDTKEELLSFRNKMLAISTKPVEEEKFDLIVAGGGVAGICCAVQAARLGLKVALINNRSLLGGASSSEVRIAMSGDYFRNKYPKLGRITRELDNHDAGMGNLSAMPYRDKDRENIVLNEKNITLFSNMHVSGVEMHSSEIKGIYALNLNTLQTHYFQGDFFADCTGDATLGLLAGADHRYGRESKTETEEVSAPDGADNLVMGTSNQWGAKWQETKSSFPIHAWMLQFTPDYHFELTQSVWNWENGFDNLHTVNDAEAIRDHNFRAIYSNWAYIKTYNPEKFGNYALSYLSHVAGKRESYRLMGDIVLTEQDITHKREYSDAMVTTNWGIDIHYPDKENSKRFPGQEFIAYAIHPLKQEDVYTIPYRCFYSQNVKNLFMAGRNISVTHLALGAVRVQRCTGMMGEVVGIAAYLCKKNKCFPRDIYEKHLNQLIHFVSGG